ncbi:MULTISPECIES: BTAD domain-containing putative transcriptional regulator [unclassified Crossiella]|uniref:AfsR/SARP family transcriptional regulator n=1 Tax=unclassified Crossiella TaxID=2620835 RepID=UPI001FFF2780|nr:MULTISPECIES: BTAD domain-containing putative transcriptional regulator [unclassified Crossiella]MCK2243338.1 tetratricopeptide repeat protein [Crossiella sp. S99.2]MCK2254193.1 tetratricopeptide repeat protein [Crossiella sp. S99.1]
MAGRGVEFRLLGPVEIVLSGRSAPVEAAKHRTLLACLVLRAGQRVEATELVGYLWDDEDRPAHPRGALQTYVRRLRRLLGAELISTVAGGYRLEVAPETADAHRFRQLLATARQTADLAERTTIVQSALALWRGPALADIASPALRRDYADPLDTERLDALALRFDAELALGRHEPLVPDLWKATAEHPLREEFWRQLMLALYRTQRQAEALETYQRAADVLRQELGVEPSPRLRDLRQSVLTNDPELAAPTVLTTALPAWQPVCQLPPDIGDFVGRDRLGLRIAEELRRGGPVLVSGPPGVGKTALAVRIGHRLRADFPDGQLHVNLHGYATEAALRPTDVLARFLRGLGVPPAQIPLEQEQQAELFRAVLRGRRVLVLLDNASAAEQVLPLLPAEPGCAALVTSRNQLSGLGFTVTLDVLRHEDARDLLARTLGMAEPEALDELAELCAHLPLALRIAAANLAGQFGLAHQVRQIREGNRLAALAVEGDHDAAVQNAFDRSYRMLATGHRRLFRHLSLIPGPDLTPASVGELIDVPEWQAARMLIELADANLVLRQEEGRYQLHDLIRLYADFRCRAEDSVDARARALRRWLGYYHQHADRAAGLLYPEVHRVALPPADRPTTDFPSLLKAKQWLDAERANLVAAVLHAVEHHLDTLSWQLADTLRGYFQHCRILNDWLTVATAGLACARRIQDEVAVACLHHAFGVLHWFLGQPDIAIEHLTHARAGLRGEADHGRLANVLSNLGMNHMDRSELGTAVDLYGQAEQILRGLGDELRLVPVLGNLGITLRRMGRLREALAHYTESHRLVLKVGLVASEPTVLNNLGYLHRELGDLPTALDFLTRSLATIDRMGGRYGETNTLIGLAAVHAELGDLAQAEELATCAVAKDETAVDRKELALGYNVLGVVLRQRGRARQAVPHHHRALELSRTIGLTVFEVEALLGLADTHQAMGEPETALAHAQAALALAAQVGYGVRIGQAHTSLARITLDLGDLAEARSQAAKALASHRETGHRPGEERTLEVLARIAEAERES